MMTWADRTRRRTWGRWELDGDWLLYRPRANEPDPSYEVSTSEIESSYGIEEWVDQLKEKRWIKPEDLVDLRAAGQYCRAVALDEASQGDEAAMRWDEYESFLSKDFRNFLESADQADERLFQDYLERHPCLLPDPFGHHELIHSAIFSQPELPGLRAKTPDFLLLAAHSDAVFPTLIEIEAPVKPWCTNRGVQHSKLTQAINQLKEWRSWFDEPTNRTIFCDVYQLDPRDLRGRVLEPRYVLVYGRRQAATRIEAFAKKRARLASSDEVFMSYDRLRPKHMDAVTIKLDRSGPDTAWRLLHIPPTFKLRKKEAPDFARLTGREEAIRGNPLITDTRRRLLLERVSFADRYAAQQEARSREA